MNNTQGMLSKDMSRRRLLQLIGKAGFGAAAASPLFGSTATQGRRRVPPTHHQIPPTLGSSGQGDVVFDDQFGNLSTDFGDLWLPGAVGVYGDGFAVIYSENPNPITDQLYQVRSYDVRAGMVPYNNNYWSTAQLGDIHMTNGIMVAPSADGGLACFPAGAVALTQNPGGVNSPNALSNLVDIGGALAYVAVDGNAYAYSFSVDANGNITGQQLWKCSLNVGFGSSAVITYGGGDYLIASEGTNVVLINLATTPPAVQPAVSLSDGALAIGISGSSYYPVLPAKGGGFSIYSYSLATSASQWGTPYHLSSQPGTPVAYGAYVFVADAGGNFTAIDALTGTFAWGFTAGGDCSQGPITVEDGIAYLCNADGIIFAVPLPPANQDPNTPYSPSAITQGQPGSYGFLMGVENGVCFYGYIDGSNFPHIAAYDMAGQVHGFSCESTLLPDGETGSPGSSQPTSPVYHTYVQLLDPNKAPRSFISVNVLAYEPVTLMDGTTDSQGNPIVYNLNPTNPSVWVTTDANGSLNLMVQAVDLTCPSLYLWATFMARDESIVIYPDAGSSQKLQSYSGSDYSAAKGYDGTLMITASNVDVNGLATAVQKAIGSGGLSTSLGAMQLLQKQRGRQYASEKRKDRNYRGRKRVLAAAESGNTNTYITFPGSTTNMLYQYPAGQENSIAYGANSADAGKSFTMDFTDGFAYSSGASAGAVSANLLGLSFSDFKAAFVHGTNVLHKIESTVSNDLKSIAHTIYSDLGAPFTLIVQTFEDAVTVVAAALKKVVGDIDKAIQWLSTLFNWGTILQNKDYLKGQVCSAITGFQTLLQAQTAAGCADITNFFNSIKTNFTNLALPNAKGAVGTSSVTSSQQNNNDPKSVFTNNSLGPANHFHSKLKNNIKNAQMEQSQSLRAFKLGGTLDSTCATATIDSLKTQVENLLSSSEKALENDLENLKTDLENFVKSFLLLCNDPSKFLQVAFSDILDLFVALIDTLIDAANLVVVGIIGLTSALIQGLMSLATATIHIPVVSSLWSAITGDALTLIDVVCLLAAIPYTIIEQASQVSKGTVGSVTPLDKAAAIFVFFSSFFDSACDADGANDPNSPLSIIDMTLDTCAFGLSYPVGDNLTALGNAYWAIQSTPIVINVINCVLFATDSEEAPAFNKQVPSYLNAFSCVNAPGAVLMAFQEPEAFMGHDGFSLIGNLLDNFVLLMKPAVNAGPGGREFVCINDVACPVTGAILGLVNDAA